MYRYVCAHVYTVTFMLAFISVHIKPLGNVSQRLVINKAFSKNISIMSSVPFLNQIHPGKEYTLSNVFTKVYMQKLNKRHNCL